MDQFNQMNDSTDSIGNVFLHASPVLASKYRRTSANSSKGDYQRSPMLLGSSLNLQHCDPYCQSDHKVTIKTEEGGSSSSEADAIKAKIIAHPKYYRLLHVYMDCQKVGAPPEVVAQLAAVQQGFESRQLTSAAKTENSLKDPELDQFMEAYYAVLVKYKEELNKPIQEAIDFMQIIEAQLSEICNGSQRIFKSEGKSEVMALSEDERENNGETELQGLIDPRAEEQELKNHLLRKYSGYLCALKYQLSKNKKKGKLPKEAREKLLNWWDMHYKWPYPSETEKIALAESTGLDHKQINNWFINQRKRHWKPRDDMQFLVINGVYQPNPVILMDDRCLYDAPYRLEP